MNNFHKQQGLEEKLITTTPFSTSFEQNYINVNSPNNNMRKSTSWLKKGLIGLATIITLGIGTNNANAQSQSEIEKTKKELEYLRANSNAIGYGSGSATKKDIEKAKKELAYLRANSNAIGYGSNRSKPSIDYSKYGQTIPEAIWKNSKYKNDDYMKKIWISYHELANEKEFRKNIKDYLYKKPKEAEKNIFLYLIMNQSRNNFGNRIDDLYIPLKKKIKNSDDRFYSTVEAIEFNIKDPVGLDREKARNLYSNALSKYITDFTKLKRIGINNQQEYIEYLTRDDLTSNKLTEILTLSFGTPKEIGQKNDEIFMNIAGYRLNNVYYHKNKNKNNPSYQGMKDFKNSYFFNEIEKEKNFKAYEKRKIITKNETYYITSLFNQ